MHSDLVGYLSVEGRAVKLDELTKVASQVGLLALARSDSLAARTGGWRTMGRAPRDNFPSWL